MSEWKIQTPRLVDTQELVGAKKDPSNPSTDYLVRLYFFDTNGASTLRKKAGGYKSHDLAIQAISRKAPEGTTRAVTFDVRSGKGKVIDLV